MDDIRELYGLYAYSRQVVLELTRSLAAFVEHRGQFVVDVDDEDIRALEAGRKFLTDTER